MNVFSIICIVLFIVNLYLGLYVFSLDKKSKINRLLLILCMIQALWNIAGIFLYSAEDKAIVWMVFTSAWIFVIPYFTLMLHFCLVITKIIKMKPWHYLVIYAPALVLVCASQFTNLLYRDLIKVNDYWYFIVSTDSAWSLFYILYYNSYILACLVLLFMWHRKSSTVKDRRQALYIFITLLLGLMASLTEGIIVPAVTSYKTPALAPIYATFWMFGVWYSVIKYRFLSITPELVSRDIIANIDELIILADNDSRVLTINHTAEQLLGCSDKMIKPRSLSELIAEYEPIENEITDLSHNNHKSFSTRIHFIKNDNSRLLMDAKFKTIYDRFGDPLGILLIGREVHELREFKSRYKITGRQAQIIQYIVQGKTNKEIANLIGLTERTIKGHITTIYHKLRISNKIQLFNVLRDHNLIPEQHAEKSILVL